jgi:hypothetical protein
MKKKLLLIIFSLVITISFAGVAMATDYYVNATGTNGNGLTHSTAWVGFNNINWSLVDSGNGILYADGTFTSRLVVGAAGESGAPVHIKGYTTSTSIRGVQINNTSFVTVEGLIVEGYTGTYGNIMVQGNSDDVILKDLIIRDAGWAGIYVLDGGVDRLVIDGCTVYHNGNNQSGTQTNPGGLNAYNAPGTIEIKNSEFYENGESGEGLDHNIYTAAGTVLTIHDSYVHDSNGGGNIQAKDTAYIYNNVLARSNQCSLQLCQSSNATYAVYNNKIFNDGMSGICIYEVNNATALIYGDSPAVYATGQSHATWDYNIIYGGGSQSQYQGTHGSYINPLYVNPPSDMSLQTSSPARDSGVTLGSSYNVDILGISRPQGSAYDVGAYEYGGGASPSLTPNAPSNIQVN